MILHQVLLCAFKEGRCDYIKSRSSCISDTRYFVDPSVATAAPGIGPVDLINNRCSFEKKERILENPPA